jgi:hypothetical protein
MLTADPGSTHFLFSGSLLAESAAIHNVPSEETYRSVGFVQALRLPADLYRNFIERFFSSSELLEARKVEERLRRTFLFSDAVTNTTLFQLAKNCTITALHAGESFVGDRRRCTWSARGAWPWAKASDAPVFGKGEFWGSDSLFESMAEHAAHHTRAAPPLKLTALDSCEVYSVPLRLVSTDSRRALEAVRGLPQHPSLRRAPLPGNTPLSAFTCLRSRRHESLRRHPSAGRCRHVLSRRCRRIAG